MGVSSTITETQSSVVKSGVVRVDRLGGLRGSVGSCASPGSLIMFYYLPWTAGSATSQLYSVQRISIYLAIMGCGRFRSICWVSGRVLVEDLPHF